VTESHEQPPPGGVFTCPHCGHKQLVHIRASDVVAIYNCPKCGQLVAPAKRNDRGDAPEAP
jgi:transcription elongation factor Elf1